MSRSRPPRLASTLLFVGTLCWLVAVGLLTGLMSWGNAPWLPEALLVPGLVGMVAGAVVAVGSRSPGTLPPLLAPTLAVVGVLLWVLSIGSTFGFVARGPTPTENALMIGGFVAGLLCHLGALAASLLRWRREGRRPVVAMGYGVVVALAVVSWLWSRGEESRFLNANPDSFVVDPAEDGAAVDVRDAAGEWRVPLDACPGAGSIASGMGLGTRQSDGRADISYGDGPYYMRLHVAERRVECFGPDGPPPAPDRLHLRLGGTLGGVTEVELRGDTLLSRAPRQPVVRTVPSDADWRAFRASLDSVGVWRWRSAYENPDVADGTEWSVDLAYPDGRVNATGPNQYPGPDGEPRDAQVGRVEGVATTPEFDRFTWAVERLTGQPFR